MPVSRSHQRLAIKIFGLFSLVRGYNIVVLILAQYLTSRYILAPSSSFYEILFDLKLFYLVLATAFSTAAGYIINNFYDAEKDKINRPKKFLLEHLLSQQSQLVLYFLLNGATLIAAGAASFKAILFFTVYIFGIWIYSSSLKRLFWISNLFATLLAIIPFFAVTIYFKNFEAVVIYHASFLFLLILIRDIVKDLQNYKGDWVRSYQTLPIVFGNLKTKIIVSALIFLNSVPIFLLIQSHLGLMTYYFYFSIPYLLFVLVLLWIGSTQKMYLWIHNLLKILILLGVIGIYFMYK
ncbi:geranylgeranylglycerol-phosphate geranylgeranyltransferase [Flavobacteriaceae bacterium]|jgi:4-hydroxybenzoate polyprenyltransferase|nr:geranylgeranylglycerol-phosphate geranylgeranyltransferase [Flavobacteriaceae bacterium]|tara:strand:- start:4621 stop:5502 length:882 start_codon:yes stop_codon:yes gene_type:complete